MKISKITSALVLLGPTAMFLFIVQAVAKNQSVYLFIALGAPLLNTAAVGLLRWSEDRWPANIVMRKPHSAGKAIRDNALKVILLTYLSAALGWMLGNWMHDWFVVPCLPQRDWIITQTVVAIVIVDFFDYWAHRYQHRNEWFWARHAIHHSVTEYSLFGAATISWVDTPFVVFPGFVALGLIGIGPIVAAATIIAWFALTTMLHANANLSLGILDRVFQVPAVHHLHHEFSFKNAVSFGGVFCIFDRCFGTHRRDGDFESPVGIGPRHP
jgi:sterol desaturase/sphingolipid hydroxylase (fatty acid hydroxylase superfamily)